MNRPAIRTSASYPVQTREERIADFVLHCTGIILAITGAILLIVFSALNASPPTVAAVSVYAAALITTFVVSVFYHFPPWEESRPVFRRIDHAAIYLKIAGTYTPLVALIGTAFAWGVLAVVWTLALGGALARLFFWRGTGNANTVIFLVLGWLSVALLWPIAQTLPLGATVLIVVGGLLYTIGAVLFSLPKLRFQNAIWHGFVIAASACFFATIAWGALSLG